MVQSMSQIVIRIVTWSHNSKQKIINISCIKPYNSMKTIDY